MPYAVPPVDTTRKPLFTPGMKVNWEHPLNRDLIGYWVFTGLPVINLAWPPPLTNTGTDFNFGSQWFDGASYLTAVGTTIFTPLKITIACRIKPATNILPYPVIVNTEKEGGGTGYILHIQDTDELKWKLNGDDVNQTILTTTSPMIVDKWYSIVASYNGTTMDLYVNGNSVGSKATTTDIAFSSQHELRCGAYRATQETNTYFRGYMDYLAIYQRGISHSEVMQLHLNPYGTPDNPRLI